MILFLPGLAPERLDAIRWPEGQVRRVAPVRGSPEAAFVGLPPTRLADGPLIVAALGAEPPERSLQFQLSWLGLDDGLLVPAEPPSAEESAALKAVLPKLDTKRLTGLFGEAVDHALVLDGYHDLGTTPLADALGRPLGEVLPEGEREEALRRYVDDSVNLLSELESNRRRVDEGRLPLSLLFPWGHGAPRRLPNLALHRGAPLTVEAASLRMRGVARLVDYRPVRLLDGLEVDWNGLAARKPGIAAVEAFAGLGEEEAVWLLRRMAPVFDVPGLAVVAGGLILQSGDAGGVPFRGDVSEDGSAPQVDLWEAVDSILTTE